MNIYTTRTRLHLDPDADGGGGGAPAADAPALGGGASADFQGQAPAFDPDAYVPKSEYQRLQSEFGETRQQYEARFRDFESRLPKPQAPEPDKAPSMKDFLNANGQLDDEGFERFQDAKIQYSLKQHRAEWEREQGEARQREDYEARQTSIIEAHAARQDAYARANPDYNPRASMQFKNAAVTLAVADSEYSAHIHHFFQKNPDKLAELRGIERDKGAIAALRFVGRLESQFEATTDVENKNKVRIAAPTKPGFGGPSKSEQPDIQKLRAFYN